jgi:hypothetical protein
LSISFAVCCFTLLVNSIENEESKDISKVIIFKNPYLVDDVLLMNQVKKYELKLIRKNKLPEEKLSIRASFKVSKNGQRMSYDRKLNQIGFIYNSKQLQLYFFEIENLELLVQKLCKYLKSTNDNRKILSKEFGYFYDSCNE